MISRWLLALWLSLLAPAVGALGMEDALFVEPDGPVQGIHRYQPARGGLDRHTSLPGAWYALLYLPMEPAWPVELVMWLPQRQQDLRLYALDRAPDQSPSTIVSLPLDQAGRNERRGTRVSQFMLPANSTASGMYVLIEQRREDGLQPAPIWLRLRSRHLEREAYDKAHLPWWVTRDPRAASSNPNTTRAPASPLSQKLREQGGFVLPSFSEPGQNNFRE